VKSFLSLSALCVLPSSLRKRRPGPHVGNAAKEQIILPPVFSRAATAAFKVGSNAGSGFLICEKSVGSWLSREVIIALLSLVLHRLLFLGYVTYLDSYGSTKRPSLRGTNGSSISGITIICACSNAGCALLAVVLVIRVLIAYIAVIKVYVLVKSHKSYFCTHRYCSFYLPVSIFGDISCISAIQ
jgi:hypothetical protein